jgi:TRAP-type C4-dicarboxylate transport system permease small subunit
LLRRALTTFTNAAAYLAAFFVCAIFVMMIAQSCMRGLGLPTGGMNDIVAWLTAASAFLAMAHAFRNGDFVRVTLLLEKVSAPARRTLEVLSLAIAVMFVGYLAFWAVRYTYESWQFKDMPTGQIALPLWIPQLSFALGALLLLAVVLDELIIVLRGGKPTFVRVVEERHARGDYSEDL